MSYIDRRTKIGETMNSSYIFKVSNSDIEMLKTLTEREGKYQTYWFVLALAAIVFGLLAASLSAKSGTAYWIFFFLMIGSAGAMKLVICRTCMCAFKIKKIIESLDA